MDNFTVGYTYRDLTALPMALYLGNPLTPRSARRVAASGRYNNRQAHVGYLATPDGLAFYAVYGDRF